MNLCDFSQLCKYYVGIICTKGKKEQKWKHVMNLVMIQLLCFKHNTKMKVDQILLDINGSTLWIMVSWEKKDNTSIS
jgi:predicted NAD-dependent protein-ADP-ribosyltransferase YbiA (DUF1768 family)